MDASEDNIIHRHGPQTWSSGSTRGDPSRLARLLLVDDDLIFRRMVYMALKGRYEVAEAESADRALAMLRRSNSANPLKICEDRIRLILLDIMLPGLDGLSFCRTVKHEFALPVIMVTARAAASDVKMAIQNGADDYLVKPIDFRALLAKIEVYVEKPAASTPQPQRARVLIVDDDESIRDLMAVHLGKRYDVLEAASGAEAIGLLEQAAAGGQSKGPVEVVLLDVMLPEVDGFRICQRIKAEYDVRVVMVTALAGPEDVRMAMSAGADDYLAKPFAGATLLEKVARQIAVSAHTPAGQGRG